MRKMQKNCCENGFKRTDQGELRRCFTCNPPVFEFGLLMEPADNEELLTRDELTEQFSLSMAEYFCAAIEAHDHMERQARKLSF